MTFSLDEAASPDRAPECAAPLAGADVGLDCASNKTDTPQRIRPERIPIFFEKLLIKLSFSLCDMPETIFFGLPSILTNLTQKNQFRDTAHVGLGMQAPSGPPTPEGHRLRAPPSHRGRG